MTNLVNLTFFIGRINIPNLDSPESNGVIADIITTSEQGLQKSILGESLYTAFQAGLQQNPIADKWVALRNKLANLTTKESPLAYFLYCEYLDQKSQDLTGVGVTESEAINNERVVSPVVKLVNAWNIAVRQVRDLYNFIELNKSDYPEFVANEVDLKFSEYKNRFGI